MSVANQITVRHRSGLHARPASQFVKLANSFSANILVANMTRGSEAVNAKSILSVLSLGVQKDHTVQIQAEGADEQAALDALVILITRNFGEAA